MSTRSSRANDAEKHAKTLQELLKLPENKYCADCNDKGPRWASVNLGIFICMRCAGIHRQMGTHVSKVKSTTLDSWTDEWVERMAEMGNEKANQVWEASRPSRKPNPQSNQPDLERYLRDKYERSMFRLDSNNGHHDRHSDRQHSDRDRHSSSHHGHGHHDDRRREPKNTDFSRDDEFDARFDSRDDVIGSSRSQQSRNTGGSSTQMKIQIKTGGSTAPPPLPARTASQPAQPAFQQQQPAPKIDSLLDWSDISAPAPQQAAPQQVAPQPQPVAATAPQQANGQADNFAAFSTGFGADFGSLAAGKSTEDKKHDIMKMFESTPNPMMGGMGGMGGMGAMGGMGGMGGMGMNMGMGGGMGGMGGMGPGMNMGMNHQGMGMNMGMGGMGAGMGMGMGGPGMHPQMGMGAAGMGGMGMNMGMGGNPAMMGGNQMAGRPQQQMHMGGMGMGMGMGGNQMGGHQQPNPFAQAPQQQSNPFGGGMFGM